MPKITEDQAENRRLQILMGALACFNEKGFHKCTMQDICKHANLSTGAVYSYFNSKDEIIQALCDSQQQRNEQLFAMASGQTNPRDAFNILVDQFFDLFHEPLFRAAVRADMMMFSEALTTDAIAQTTRCNLQQIRSRLESLVISGQQAGLVSNTLKPTSIALSLMALFQGLGTLIQFDPDIDIESYKDVVRSLLFGNFWKTQ